MPDAFVAYIDPSLMQQVFNVSQRKRKTLLHHHRGNSPIPFPDIGSGGGGGKVKTPGKNHPDGPIGGGGDYGIAGVGGFKQLTDGGQFISSGSTKVMAEGNPVALTGSMAINNETEDEPEEEEED